MKKIMILILMACLLIASVGAITITQEELNNYTDQKIANYLVNNIEAVNPFIDQESKVIYLPYNIPTIYYNNGNYTLTTETIYTTLRLEDIRDCLDEYSITICENNLIYRLTPLMSLDNTSSIAPSYYQLKQRLINTFNKIKEFQKRSVIDISGFGDNVTNPEVTI